MNDNNILDNTGFYDGLSLVETRTLFDDKETTIAHLFRFPHPALLGLSYGAAFCYALIRRGLITNRTTSIIEVGGGLGDLAESFLSYLSFDNSNSHTQYTIVDISPALQHVQKAKLSSFNNVNFVLATAETLPFIDDQFTNTTIISNEVIADLKALSLTPVEFLNSTDQSVTLLRDSYLAIQGSLPQLTHNIIVNSGAIQFIKELNRILKSASSAIITEHGDGRARLIECGSLANNAQEMHSEVSIDFDHLVLVAQYLGFETEILHLIDFLPISKSMRVANYNDAKALQGDKSENWQIEAIPLQKVYEVYTNKIGSIEAQKLVQGFLDGGLQFPEIGGDKFPDNNTLPFRQAFKVLILRKS